MKIEIFDHSKKSCSHEGSKTDGLTSQLGLEQIIKEPIHIIGDSSSCIDLIFTTQPNLVMESGVHSLLHSNYHHPKTFAKFNLKIHYSHPYEWEVWPNWTRNMRVFLRQSLCKYQRKRKSAIVYSTLSKHYT